MTVNSATASLANPSPYILTVTAKSPDGTAITGPGKTMQLSLTIIPADPVPGTPSTGGGAGGDGTKKPESHRPVQDSTVQSLINVASGAASASVAKNLMGGKPRIAGGSTGKVNRPGAASFDASPASKRSPAGTGKGAPNFDSGSAGNSGSTGKSGTP